jgi:hypothetical protein
MMTRLPSGSLTWATRSPHGFVGGLLDHRAADGPDDPDDGVAVVGADPQGDALDGGQVDSRIVSEPEVRRAEVQRDERRRT